MLDAASQRELAETIRERSQLALTGFAQLNAVFAAPAISYGPGEDPNQHRLGRLQRWVGDPKAIGPGALGDLTDDEFQAYANNLQIAAQLHSVAAEESLRLMARSRSARLPYGEKAGSLEQQEWGAQSWHQRLFSAAFGGDPLSAAEGAPWDHPQPLALSGFYPGVLNLGWPAIDRLPYVTSNTSRPQVDQLLRLARNFDTLNLAVKAGPFGCLQPDAEAAGDRIFRDVELALRRYHCTDAASGDIVLPCTAGSLEFPSDDGETFLWQMHRIERDHADLLASRLIGLVGEVLPGTNSDSNGETCREKARVGALRPRAPAGAQVFALPPELFADYVRIHKDTTWVSRTLVDVAPQFSRLSNKQYLRSEELMDGVPASQIGFSNAAFEVVQNTDYFSFVFPGHSEDAKRRLGIMSSLAASRILLRSAIVAGGELSADPREANVAVLSDVAEGVLPLLDAQVGPTVYSFTPALSPVPDVDGNLRVRKLFDRYHWKLHVDSNGADDFLELAPGEKLWAYAVRDDAYSADLLREPGNHIFGRSAADVLADAAYREMIALPTVGDAVRFETLQSCFGPVCVYGLILPAEPSNEPTSRYTLALWKATEDERGSLGSDLLEIDKSDLRVIANSVEVAPGYPQGGVYIALGGTLGGFLNRQNETSNALNRHRYDGFELPTNWVPPFSAELVGGSSP